MSPGPYLRVCFNQAEQYKMRIFAGAFEMLDGICGKDGVKGHSNGRLKITRWGWGQLSRGQLLSGQRAQI